MCVRSIISDTGRLAKAFLPRTLAYIDKNPEWLFRHKTWKKDDRNIFAQSNKQFDFDFRNMQSEMIAPLGSYVHGSLHLENSRNFVQCFLFFCVLVSQALILGK